MFRDPLDSFFSQLVLYSKPFFHQDTVHNTIDATTAVMSDEGRHLRNTLERMKCKIVWLSYGMLIRLTMVRWRW